MDKDCTHSTLYLYLNTIYNTYIRKKCNCFLLFIISDGEECYHVFMTRDKSFDIISSIFFSLSNKMSSDNNDNFTDINLNCICFNSNDDFSICKVDFISEIKIEIESVLFNLSFNIKDYSSYAILFDCSILLSSNEKDSIRKLDLIKYLVSSLDIK